MLTSLPANTPVVYVVTLEKDDYEAHMLHYNSQIKPTTNQIMTPSQANNYTPQYNELPLR